MFTMEILPPKPWLQKLKMPLPEGAQMYYDVEPKGDSRHARAILGTLTKELAFFF